MKKHECEVYFGFIALRIIVRNFFRLLNIEKDYSVKLKKEVFVEVWKFVLT